MDSNLVQKLILDWDEAELLILEMFRHEKLGKQSSASSTCLVIRGNLPPIC
ncbi:hypothetical protein H6G04_17740 [Calothrix membranacea FACHB-236]|nr:hypothetical protein [Calothrix membranacea FACHB-236]